MAMAAEHHTEDRVCVGAITGVRGLRGEVRIKSFTADPADVAAYGPVSVEEGDRSFDIRVTARVKDRIIARLAGVDDRTAAEELKGTKLYVPRSALPEADDGTYYLSDLVGLRAETATGRKLGRVRAVHNFGAGDVVEIAGDGKAGLMVPFTHAAVPEVDIEHGRIVVEPPPEISAAGGGDGKEEG